MGEDSQKGQTSNQKKYKPRGCNVQQGDYSKQCFIAYLKVAKRIDLKSSHHKKNSEAMNGDGC